MVGMSDSGHVRMSVRRHATNNGEFWSQAATVEIFKDNYGNVTVDGVSRFGVGR